MTSGKQSKSSRPGGLKGAATLATAIIEDDPITAVTGALDTIDGIVNYGKAIYDMFQNLAAVNEMINNIQKQLHDLDLDHFELSTNFKDALQSALDMKESGMLVSF